MVAERAEPPKTVYPVLYLQKRVYLHLKAEMSPRDLNLKYRKCSHTGVIFNFMEMRIKCFFPKL